MEAPKAHAHQLVVDALTILKRRGVDVVVCAFSGVLVHELGEKAGRFRSSNAATRFPLAFVLMSVLMQRCECESQLRLDVQARRKRRRRSGDEGTA